MQRCVYHGLLTWELGNDQIVRKLDHETFGWMMCELYIQKQLDTVSLSLSSAGMLEQSRS